MRIAFGVMLPILAALAPPAHAAPGHDFGGGVIRVQVQDANPRPSEPPPNRELRRPERPPEQAQRPGGRLTDEERRDLNRDLDRANREIYKGKQR